MDTTWINSEILTTFSSSKYKNAKPFEHLSLEKLFSEEKVKNLVSALKEQEYYIEDHDLYQFLRTTDFKHSKNNTIKEFREYIFSDSFVSSIEKITGLKLLRGKGDLHSLKLLNGHYLLCHDDQVQGRAVAFILNLSKHWSEKDGGSLELFSVDSNGSPCKISKSITPTFNQFNLFTVSSKSFHQISEVLSEHKERISISGWFYLETKEKGAFEESPKK
jgi:Rps23 Pro-64 3,4-dihydroxylase Tpa1-like proline 4-hydroxylase